MSEHGLSIGKTHALRGERRGVSRLLAIGSAAFLVAGVTIVASQVSASATGVTGTMTVTPSSGLTNGAMVTIGGSGFTKSSIGNVLECNNAPNEPTAALGAPINNPVAVGCTAPSLTQLVQTDASGNLASTQYKIAQGTIGPPCGPSPAAVTCPATDSAGQSPAADAANYPCPPTAAQQAAGVVCQLNYGDAAGDSAMVTITFAGTSSPTTAPPTTAPPTTPTTRPATTATTTAPATGAGSGTTAPSVSGTPAATGSLAATGPGRGVGWLGAVGGVLLVFGLLLFLVLFNVPQRAFAGVFDRDAMRRVSVTAKRGSGGTLVTARALTRRVVSTSVRTATWFLGR